MNEKHGNKKQNVCQICQQIIVGSSYKLRAHLYHHNAVPSRFKCNICSKEYFRRDEFTKHMSSHTGLKKQKTYVCDHCDRCFREKRNLIGHLKVHDDNCHYSYKCMACGKGYCEERLLKYHIRKAHYNLNSNGETIVKKECNETWLEQVKESEVYVQMTKVNSNVLSIRKFGTIKSDVNVNSGGTNTTNEFKNYISSVFAQKITSQYSKATCDYCNKDMLKKSLLSHIRERHLKIKKFKCEECRKTFSRHYQMVDHICGKERKNCKFNEETKKRQVKARIK